jgi:uncharacterized membrane protein YjjP (DUF1212 family)
VSRWLVALASSLANVYFMLMSSIGFCITPVTSGLCLVFTRIPAHIFSYRLTFPGLTSSIYPDEAAFRAETRHSLEEVQKPRQKFCSRYGGAEVKLNQPHWRSPQF